ncbi:MAG: hypothetical protein JWM80_2805 [Cyanobacteria bacterium RYN_339]|nr:hypothetical protein [Cyanobacteria bacterium RYN_339]
MAATPIQSRTIVATAPNADTMSRVRRIASGSDGHAGVLTRDQLLTDVKWGVAISAPMEGVFNAGAYRKGEINASKYTATIIANSLGFGAWTVGGALAAAALAPVGLPAFAVAVAGFAAGMIANDLWDRTFGQAMIKVLSERIPNKIVKPFADFFTKFVAAPLTDWVWNPLKNLVMGHKIAAGVLVGGAMLLPPLRPLAKGLAREAGVWIGGSAIALGAQFALINRILPASDKGKTTEAAGGDAEALKILEDAYTTAVTKFKEKGATAEQADAAAQKWLIQTLQDNGAKLPDAQALVKAAADDLKAKKK